MAVSSSEWKKNTTRDRLIALWEKSKPLVFYTLLITWGLICLSPLYFTLVFSFKPIENAYNPPLWLPLPFTLSNYETVFTSFSLFPRWLLNSTVIAVSVTILRVLFCAMEIGRAHV